MTRLFGFILCVTLVGLIAFSLGSAIDNEVQNRVLVPQNGALWDCERIVYPHGHLAYTNCHIVP